MISSLWQVLLMNIKSPSTTALLKLATPLQISPNGVVLTFKNERLVAQISDSNKKQMIIDAANIMFNQDSTSVTVRLAQSGDKPVQVSSVPTQQPTPVKPVETVSQAVADAKNEAKATPEVSKTEEPLSKEKVERLESDQEKMVLELFDGKYVE